MSDLTEREITNSYHKIRNSAKESFAKGEYDKCLEQIELSANIAYNFNFFYKDDVLEGLLSAIAGKLFSDTSSAVQHNGRVVFYDYFGIANRGLTQQYLQALMALDIEFLYVLENYVVKSDAILVEIKTYDKAQVLLVDPGLSLLDKIKFVHEKIVAFKPEKALLHLHPASVVAVTVWNALSHVERYQVNLTDHAFWLGVSCIDYSLEFRDYGCTVSIEQRGIPKEKLLLQPYYPITDCGEFKGLPELGSDKVLIFTGGTYYKMYGGNNAFFTMLKRLLDENPQTVVLLAGDGDADPIHKFISSNGYENRFYLIGNRTDINHIFQRCDIYLSTYPITGGLMSQYAAVNSKPILSYSDANIPCNDVESFLTFGDQDANITFHQPEPYFDYAQKLINSKTYREEIGAKYKQRVIDVPSFNTLLFKNLYQKNIPLAFEKIHIDYARFSQLYLEVENNYLFSYRTLLVMKFKLRAFLDFPREMLHPKFIKKLMLLIKNKISHA
ncbi:hypothetical protein IWX76_003237 [Pedobacter sp. CAN_A7]|uniref:hypothetical protein n=1 Tax=Pedobacter sp. CAN_A7 TaxID=2787722 RepID=UPI0018CB4B5F